MSVLVVLSIKGRENSYVRQVDASCDAPFQGQLYVIGGSNGHSDELSCGERYDPHADEWVQVPELRTNRCNAGQSLYWNLIACLLMTSG